MFKHRFQKRVRYGETDQMGYLYYGNYALLFEIGRAEAIRSLGLTYNELEKSHNIMMPVVNMVSNYHKPAYYDDLLSIDTILLEMPSRVIHFYFEIFNEAEVLLHKAEVKLVFVDMLTNKVTHAPSYLTEMLKPYFD